MNSCHRCLTFWQAAFEFEPEPWFIRFIPEDFIWANRYAQEKFNVPARQPWDHAMRWCHHEDARRLEDNYSLALKTMQPQTFEFRFKISPTAFVRMHNRITPVHCEGCPLHCGLVVIFVQPVADRDSDSVQEHGEEGHS